MFVLIGAIVVAVGALYIMLVGYPRMEKQIAAEIAAERAKEAREAYRRQRVADGWIDPVGA